MAAVAGFNVVPLIGTDMQCHYCDREADIAVEKEGVKVGVCKTHFQEQMEDLADSEFLEGVESELDIDRRE